MADKVFLIDGAALCRVLEDMEAAACDGTENDGTDGTTRVEYPVATTTREMIDLIAELPTVELVQCNQCEYWEGSESSPCARCKHWSTDEIPGILRAIHHMTRPDGYCSEGQRRIADGSDIRG